MQGALRYKRTRVGDIAFAVRTDSRFWAYRPDHVEWSASVLKAMLLVAYLDRPSVAHRDLNESDRALLSPMITVSDNGIGFNEKHASKIFRMFVRLHGRAEYEGSGIGLAICRKIVERHGGTIVATSTAGEGATFTVTLPVTQAATGFLS